MIYQDFEWTVAKTQKLFSKNPRRSLSAVFRHLRSLPRLSLIGDYPILSTVLEEVAKLGVFPKRSQVVYALNQSQELSQFSKREKTLLLDQLANPLSVASDASKPRRNHHKKSSITKNGLFIHSNSYEKIYA